MRSISKDPVSDTFGRWVEELMKDPTVIARAERLDFEQRSSNS